MKRLIIIFSIILSTMWIGKADAGTSDCVPQDAWFTGGAGLSHWRAWTGYKDRDSTRFDVCQPTTFPDDYPRGYCNNTYYGNNCSKYRVSLYEQRNNGTVWARLSNDPNWRRWDYTYVFSPLANPGTIGGHELYWRIEVDVGDHVYTETYGWEH